jgi:hypothetical protein
MQDLSGMSSRKLKYNFGDLQGIVFGIKTSSADKLAILRMIEVKCHAEGRKNFEFYQAYYSHKTGKIENVRLGLLKFD